MKNTTVKYYLTFILWICVIGAYAQTSTGSIEGLILSESHAALPKITIRLNPSSLAAISDEEGRFYLKEIPEGLYSLTASGIGYGASTIRVEVKAGKTTQLNLELNAITQSLREVIVNASGNSFAVKKSDYVSKMPLDNIENPQVYHSVSKELIREQLVYSVDDAIRNAPGIQKMWEATGRSGDGGSFYNTRGFISQSTLRNGIAGNVSNTIDASNLERLEVIKGPSATLFGSALTSYGGAINRVTKAPLEEFQAEVSVAGGSNRFHRISTDINTPLSADRRLLFRINAAYNSEDSFQKPAFRKSLAVSPSILFKAGERTTLRLDAEFQEGENSASQFLFFYYPSSSLGIESAADLPMDYDNSYHGEGLTQRSRSTNLFAQLHHELNDAFQLSTNLSYGSSYSDGFSSYLYLVPDDVVTGNPDDAGQSHYIARADQSTNDSRDRVFQVQQNLNGDFHIGNMRNRVVFGLDLLVRNSDQQFFGREFDVVPSNDPTFDYTGFNGTTLGSMYDNGQIAFTYPIVNKVITYSAFASDVLNITDQLSVLAALRADRYDNRGGTEGTSYEGYQQTAFSPKLGIVFQPVEDRVSLFANYQNSFNNLGFYTSYNPAAADSIVQRAADLEQANQLEGGVKLDLFQGKLTATLSYYHIQVENILRTDPNPEAAMRFGQIQDGTQRSKGFELDLIAQPVQGLNVIAGFSYNDSEFTRADADVLGRRPATASSPYLANLWVSYHFPASIVKGLGVGLGGNYASDNRIVNSSANGRFILPAYTLINAAAFYDIDKFRLSVKVDNIGNQKHWIGYTTANAQKLRTMVAGLSYRF